MALCYAGCSLILICGDLDEGPALIDRALVLNPNWATAWHFSAMAKAFLGEPTRSIEHATRAMRLSPQDPQMFAMRTTAAWGHFFSGRYDESALLAETAVREQPNFLVANCIAAASNALADRPAEAAKAMARLRQFNPDLRLSNLKALIPLRRSEDFERWAQGLRKAGLPES